MTDDTNGGPLSPFSICTRVTNCCRRSLISSCIWERRLGSGRSSSQKKFCGNETQHSNLGSMNCLDIKKKVATPDDFLVEGSSSVVEVAANTHLLSVSLLSCSGTVTSSVVQHTVVVRGPVVVAVPWHFSTT